MIPGLSELQSNMKWSSEQQVIFEAGLIKICLSDKGSYAQVDTNKQIANNNILLNKNVSLEEINDGLTSKVLTKLKENGKMRIQADLITTKIELQEDGIVHIIFNGNIIPAIKANFQKEETKIAIKQAVAQTLGKEVSVKYDNFK